MANALSLSLLPRVKQTLASNIEKDFSEVKKGGGVEDSARLESLESGRFSSIE
jgi:hypothetical protein